ncbi:MAG: hypothetical protein OJF50_005565 [Nitrospira sp.]|nr:hypothetical protein [Nitrospira sp.]
MCRAHSRPTYHDEAPPTWFGLYDFKVLLKGQPRRHPRAQFTDNKDYRWYSQK